MHNETEFLNINLVIKFVRDREKLCFTVDNVNFIYFLKEHLEKKILKLKSQIMNVKLN